MSLLCGSMMSGKLVKLIGAILSDVVGNPTDASVGYRINTSGSEDTYIGIAGSYASIGTWLLVGASSEYEAQLTVNSGDTPAGSPTGSYISCDTSPAWTLTETTDGAATKSNNCTIDVRNKTTLLGDSATVTMSVETI